MKRRDPFTLASNIRVLLGFADPWKDTQTKSFKYELVLQSDFARDVLLQPGPLNLLFFCIWILAEIMLLSFKSVC